MAHDTMPHPTPGWIVRFVDSDKQTWPAMVHRVWSAECVNLTAFTDAGPKVYTSVTLDESGEMPVSWHWSQF